MHWIHCSSTPVTAIRRRRQSTEDEYKPNGLWLSAGNAWQKWHASEGIQRTYAHEYRVTISHDKLLTLDTPSKVSAFHRRYSTPEGTIHWNRVATEHCGIIFRPYFRRLREKYDWYAMLDIPCACVWSPTCIEGIDKV